jgi:hypothetical protein
LISYNACLALGYGSFGSRGNSIATGLLLFTLPLLLFVFSFQKSFRIQPADFIFADLVLAALLSFLVNSPDNETSSTKEYLLLVASLAGYIACRPMLAEDATVIRSAFERITAAIVLVGAIFTAAEIFSQWDGPPGKPRVFGFDAAGTYFMTSLGFLVIALVTVDKPRSHRTAIVSALIFLPAVIFAAAMVRFTFIALAGSLFLAMMLTEGGKRWHVAVVAIAIFLAVIVGLSARYSTAKVYAGYIFEQTVETSIVKQPMEFRAKQPRGPLAERSMGPLAEQSMEPVAGETPIPSCRLAVNTRNSIAIRQALARDAFYLIPIAGFIGTGLDSFMRFSCIQAHQVHISILQAAAEFGWLGGAFFMLLIGLALYGLVPLAKHDGAIRFILCSLVFAVFLSLAHGRISRDSALFALLGCAVGVCDFRRSTPEQRVQH